MSHVRDYYNFNLSNLTLYKLTSAFCTEIIKEPSGYKYLWYKVHYRQQIDTEIRDSFNQLLDSNGKVSQINHLNEEDF